MKPNLKIYRRGDRVHQFSTIEMKAPTLFDEVYAMGGTVLAASVKRSYVKWDVGYNGPVWVPNAYLFPGEPPPQYLTGYEESEISCPK